LRRKEKAMPNAHPPTSPPVAASSHAKKLGPTTVWDRLDNVSQQSDANADPRQIFGASRTAGHRAVGRRTAGIPNLRQVRDITPSLEFRTIHGYQCAFRVAGSGPAIVLIHGLGGNSSTWNTVQTRLAHRFTVIAPDLLGHGKSDKPRTDYSAAAHANGLRDLLSVLGVDRISLVGHSLGGGVAMQFAYQFPELVQRLVLVATGGITRDVSIALRLASLPMVSEALAALRLPGALPALRLAGWAVRLAAGSTGFGRDLPHVLRALAELREPAASAAFSRTLRAVVDWRGQMITMLDRCYLAEPIPVQLIWGEQDSVIPVGDARLAHAAMPGSRLTVFDRCGHFPFHDDPDRFIEVVERFIDSSQVAAYDQKLLRHLLRTGLRQHATSGRVDTRSPAEDVTESSSQLRVLRGIR
jgi:pimeloyl-ACP methyl ester carboxylesterase